MISALNRIIAGLCLLFLLAACGTSPPSKFYRLTAAATAVAATAGDQEPALGIGPVEIPEFLNRNALVYTRGGNQLQIDSTERWAEPLGYGIERVVGLNLAQLLGSENLRFFPWDLRRAPDYGVRLTVLDLDAGKGQATLVVDWVIYNPADGKQIARRISRFSQALAAQQPQPSELPGAYSTLLYQLSETIADVIKQEQDRPTAEPGKT